MLIKAEDLAYESWPDILARAGVDRSFLSGRNGPCPFCPDGGTDRFQFQSKNGGRYVCRHCTNGRYRSGFDFLMRHLGLATFREAADYVRDYFNAGDPNVDLQSVARAARKAAAKDELTPETIAKRVARMQDIWAQSRPIQRGDPVDLYLRKRFPKLGSIPLQIQCHPGLEYWDAPAAGEDRPVLRGRFPAQLVRGFDRYGRLVQLHKTYLTADGEKADVRNVKKTDVGVGCNAFALELGDPVGDTLGVSEGVETALGAMLLRPEVPVWPCHASTILANFALPDRLRGQVKRLVIYEDNDAPKGPQRKRAGHDAGATLADRARKEGIRSMIVRPAKTGFDMANLATSM